MRKRIKPFTIAFYIDASEHRAVTLDNLLNQHARNNSVLFETAHAVAPASPRPVDIIRVYCS